MPAKLPTATHILRGTHRPDRCNSREPAMSCVDPPRPDADLQQDQAAVWNRLANVSRPLGVYSPADREWLQLCAVSLARAERASRDPECTHDQVIRPTTLAAGLPRDFGLSPVSRTRVASLGPATPDNDPLNESVS
jgi:hypothetical protein